MQIHQLAALTRTSVVQIDRYVERGLLRPRHTGDGRRTFSAVDIATVDAINELVARGFPTMVVKAMLEPLATPSQESQV